MSQSTATTSDGPECSSRGEPYVFKGVQAQPEPTSFSNNVINAPPYPLSPSKRLCPPPSAEPIPHSTPACLVFFAMQALARTTDDLMVRSRELNHGITAWRNGLADAIAICPDLGGVLKVTPQNVDGLKGVHEGLVQMRTALHLAYGIMTGRVKVVDDGEDEEDMQLD